MTKASLLFLNALRRELKKWGFFFICCVNLGYGFESNPLLIVNLRKGVGKKINKRKNSIPVDDMKMRLCVMSLLAFLCAAPGWSSTTVVSFGETGNTYQSPWNLQMGSGGTLGTPARTTTQLRDTTNTVSAITVKYNGGGLAGTTASTNTALSALGLNNTTIGSGGKSLWQQAHGTVLDDAKTARGWNQNLVLGVGGLVDAGSIAVSGLQANSSYTVSSVFTVSGLANVATWTSGSPVNLTGNGLSIKNAYLSGTNGQVVDLLHIGSGSLATLLSSGTFMLTWQFTTGASTTSATMDFADSLLSLGGNYAVSAMGVTEGMPNLTVPEPATASLSLLGLAALLMRRRRSC